MGLYYKYKELKEKDPVALQDVIKNLYEEGKKFGWKVPVGQPAPELPA